jgi:hypothetical protein
VTKDYELARKGMKACGIEPFNPNWVEEHAHVFKPSEAFRTTGANWALGAIVRKNPVVNTMTDASHILEARKAMSMARGHPAVFAEFCENHGETEGDAGAGTVLGKRNFFESRSAGMILNDPGRLQKAED